MDTSNGLILGGAAAVVTVATMIARKLNRVFGYNHAMIDGVVYPPFQTEARHKEVCAALKLDPSRDVWIATYPKCGTTWMQQIVLELTRHKTNANGTAEASGEKIDYHESPWPEAMLLRKSDTHGPAYKGRTQEEMEACFRWGGKAKGPRSLRFLKTHALYRHLPGIYGVSKGADHGRAIVVTRNPKDACVSMFHHARRIPIFEYSGPFDDWVERWKRGEVESGCFWKWHAGWWTAKLKSESTILWLFFEDMKKNPAIEIERVAKFLGLDENLSAKDLKELVDRVVKATTFTKMKSQYKSGHFRKGKSGGWREWFTPKQSEAYDRAHAIGFKDHPGLRKKYKF
eukprot:g1684.t1